MNTVKVKCFMLVLILLSATSIFAKITRYESEDLFSVDTCSSIIYDPDASNDTCRVAYVDSHYVGHMQYGPYDIFLPGYYFATFKLKRGTGINDSMKSLINPVCILDVTGGIPINKFYAYQKLYASSFDSVNKYQSFIVGFYLSDTTYYVQFRIKFLDSVDVYADYVDVGPNFDTLDIVYAVNLHDPELVLSVPADPSDSTNVDRRILLGSIQGGVNRKKPRLVFLHNPGTSEGQGIHRWLHALDIPYTLLTYEECVERLVRQEYFKGCVLFNPGVMNDSTINKPPMHQKLLFQVKAIATNLAALDSLLIVTPRTLADSLIDTSFFPIKYDLTDTIAYPFLSDSTGEQALNYNLSLFDTCDFNKDIIFKLFPYMSFNPYANAAEKLTDFTIQNRYWSFYKDLMEDSDTTFLEQNRFNSTYFLMGYADEWRKWQDTIWVSKCAEYYHFRWGSTVGKLWIGDMNRIHNLSFFAKVPYDTHYTYPQLVPATPALENKVYISFLTMDGDNPILLLKHFRKDWDSPLRGTIPVTWGFPPKMLDLAPSILQHYYKTKAPSDCIIADVSGLAVNLTNHFDFNDFPDMFKVANEYLNKLHIKVVKLMADYNKDLANIDYLQRFIEECPGIGVFIEGYWPPWEQGFMMVKEECPSIRLAANRPIKGQGDPPNVDTLVGEIRQIINSTPDKPLFLPVIYNIYGGGYKPWNSLFDKLDSITTMLDDEYGGIITYIRQDVMMSLVKMYYDTTNVGFSVILNQGFEEGIEHWVPEGNVSIDSTEYHSGLASLKLQNTSSVKQSIDVVGGQKYRFKVWLKPYSNSTGTFKVIWYPYSVDTVFSYKSKDTPTDWLFYFRDLRAPSGTDSAVVYCECDSGTVWFDDVEVNIVGPPWVTLLSPEGGEYLKPGVETVRWNVYDFLPLDSDTIDDAYELYYCLNYEEGELPDWLPASGEFDDSNSVFLWNVPDTTSVRCRFRVAAIDSVDSLVRKGYDFSGSNFVIDNIPPSVVLKSPVGGERWEIGGLHKIEWDADDNIGILYQKIFFYVGASVVELDSVDGEVREYYWDIPDTTSSECRIGITVSDSSRNEKGDASDYFAIGPLFSDTSLASAMNGQRKVYIRSDGNPCFVYHSSRRVFFDYSEDGGETYEQVCIGEGGFPALSRYTEKLTAQEVLAVVWVRDGMIYFSRHTDVTGWSEPYPLIAYVGGNIYCAPPSLVIDGSGIGHLAWEKIAEPEGYPGYVGYELHHSTFNAGLEEPIIIEDVILDEAIEYVTHPVEPEYVSASLDLDDNNPVVAWSRAIGEGKNTVYFKQRLGGVWPADPEVVSIPEEVSVHPFCDVEDGIIHVVWEDEGLIKYRQRGSMGWSSIEPVSDITLSSRSPQILDGDICVYTEVPPFQDFSNVVYRKRFPDGWHSSNIIESTSYLSEYPQSYVETRGSSKVLHTVWTEGNEVPYGVRYGQKILPLQISGHIVENTTWDGDIYITGDVVIDPGVTLTISPGARVMFFPLYDDQRIGVDDNRCELIVEGILDVVGTASDSIYFISSGMEPEMRDWYGIRFTSPDVSSIEYSNIEFARYGISCEANSAPILQNVSISNNEMGVRAMLASLTIKKGSIFDNLHGIYCGACSGVVIDSCNISDNPPSRLLRNRGEEEIIPFENPEDTLQIPGTGIYLSNCDEVSVTNNRIVNDYRGVYAKGFVNGVFEGNYVESNEWHGFDIAVTRGSQMQFLNNTFINNARYPINHGMHKNLYRQFAGLSLGFGGIHTGETDILIKGNTFEDNTCGTRFTKYYPMPSPGTYNVRYEDNRAKDNFYGFALSAPTGASGYTGTLVFNKVEQNDSAGVFILFGIDSGAVCLGNLSDADTTNDGANHIRWNGTWDAMNVCPFLTYGHGNLWSSSIAESIDALILDNEEDPSNGMVDFSGFYTAGELTEDETWDGTVSICGDILVPDKITLTIVEGTKVRFAANFDINNIGVDKERSELIVDGNIEIKPASEVFDGPGEIATAFQWINYEPWESINSGQSGDELTESVRLENPRGGNVGSPVHIHLPVIFTSDAYEPLPSDWYGIELGGLNWENGEALTEPITGLTRSNLTCPISPIGLISPIDQKDSRQERNIHYFEIEYAKRGLVLCEGENLSMKDCTFRNNEAGLKLTRNSDITVKDCVFKDNTTYGIFVGDGVTGTMKGDTVASNSTGIIFEGNASVETKGLVIEVNDTGIFVSGTSRPTIKESRIINNTDYGVYIINKAEPNLGGGKGHNYIFGSGLYDLYNNTANKIMAKKNYWGTMNIDTVQAHIYDYYDNPHLGIVEVEPLWEGERSIGGAMLSGTENKFIFSLKISPNPFSSSTSINFTLPSIGYSAEGIELNIYDISGRLVKSFSLDTEHLSLTTAVVWDGSDNNNKKVATGVYFTRLKSRNFTSVKKVILVR